MFFTIKGGFTPQVGMSLIITISIGLSACENEDIESGQTSYSEYSTPASPTRYLKEQCGICGHTWYSDEIYFNDDFHAKDCLRSSKSPFLDQY